METVAVCDYCGKTINNEFHFCPWCGAQAKKNLSFEEILSDACCRIAQNERKRTISVRISAIEKEIDTLDSALTDLMSADASRQ